MNTAKVGRRGQLTLPKDIREELDIEEGQRVAFVRRGGSISLLPLNESLSNHYGSIEVEGPQDFDALRAEARRRKAQERVQADVSSETAQSDAQ
ncbi:AbrB/MazE/SpoVT family DNA-binding domain-containing protein [Salinibacter sp.]|uniref:AbrB/MazE/SpoVT family DNA-binding domain-containing protein n=1 Tax=Salinibacter sp. TaxID=2065818 RepID=UPI0021E95D32|nr:AbrB/MazE/SpoVT family DNA-binding domain-containing protein [Salinibacter sp.]